MEVYNVFEKEAQKYDNVDKRVASRIREEGLRRAQNRLTNIHKTRRKYIKNRRGVKTRKHRNFFSVGRWPIK
jgi:hypothetical protein